MTKKLITLIMAVLLPLSAFYMNADEKEAKKIPLTQGNIQKLERSLFEIPLESYYIGMMDAIQTSVTTDVGIVEMNVTMVRHLRLRRHPSLPPDFRSPRPL